MNTEAAFHFAMSDIYTRARTEVGYNPSYFLQMLADLGALGTAKQLLHSKQPSDGFTRMWELGALHLTVEALVIQPPWQHLFTDQELRTARRRLRDYGYVEPVRPSSQSEATDTAPVSTEGHTPLTILRAVQKLNRRGQDFRIGQLQEIRKKVKQLRRTGTKAIFAAPMNEEWAYHSGGRNELQFNVGFEPRADGRPFRHGVAFSLEPSLSLTRPLEVLLPKVQRFNDFFQTAPGAFEDMRLWIHSPDGWSPDYEPRRIESREAVEGNFIFLGHRYPAEDFNPDRVLHDFDRLLDLYEYVEAAVGTPQYQSHFPGGSFTPGHRSKVPQGTLTLAERTLSIEYRHNVMQDEIYELLVDQFGREQVGTEWPWAPGIYVDIAVRQGDEYWFYELKTAPFARACVRQGLAQLLEYSYWPHAPKVSRMILVGEPAADGETVAYLGRLREIGIPIYYQQYVSAERRFANMI